MIYNKFDGGFNIIKLSKTRIICILVAALLIIPISLATNNFDMNNDYLKEKRDPLAMNNVTIIGNYSGFYNFPSQFFLESNISKEDVVKVTDAQYLALLQMHNGIHPYDFCKIEYDPNAYGYTTPTGFKLGIYAFPSYHNGHHCWHVMGHEQAHNFFGGTSWFYYTIAAPYPFLQESLAVISSMYTYHIMLEKYDLYCLTQNVIESLDYIYLEEERVYQQNRYEEYIQQGCPFNINDVLTSQALDYQMILYGELYGWHNYEKVTKAFENGLRSRFDFYYNGANATEQATYIVTTLSVAFNKDFRSDFQTLGFPIDNILYEKWYDILRKYIPTIADLECDGILGWTDVKPGEKLLGEFYLRNIGESDSLLSWTIESYPSWGNWIFTPSKGLNLTPDVGTITIRVEVIAPDKPNQQFTGEIKIVNTKNTTDYDIVSVTLKTPVKNYQHFQQFIKSFSQCFPHAFPLLRQLID